MREKKKLILHLLSTFYFLLLDLLTKQFERGDCYPIFLFLSKKEKKKKKKEKRIGDFCPFGE